MPDAKQGYRVSRLRRRREGKAQHVQTWVLYGLAAVVAFGAVLGAWYLGSRWLGSPPPSHPSGYLTLFQVTPPGSDTPVAAALAVKDPSDGSYALYVVPRDLLLEGASGEYVFAGDAMARGDLGRDLERLIGVPVDAVYTVPAPALARLAGTGDLQLSFTGPASVQVDGSRRSFEESSTVVARELGPLFAASGPTGYDAARLQAALWSAVLEAAALRPDGARRDALAAVAAQARGTEDTWFATDALQGLTKGDAPVLDFPAESRVAEGQFAFLPDTDRVMAELTRRSPKYESPYTVQVQNGTGQVGVGRAVADQLAVLDVNLPPVVNADTFDHRQTSIYAGTEALQVAGQVRAILGRGVVLNGPDLPARTVVVIVGADKPKHTKAKDQQ